MANGGVTKVLASMGWNGLFCEETMQAGAVCRTGRKGCVEFRGWLKDGLT